MSLFMRRRMLLAQEQDDGNLFKITDVNVSALDVIFVKLSKDSFKITPIDSNKTTVVRLATVNTEVIPNKKIKF